MDGDQESSLLCQARPSAGKSAIDSVMYNRLRIPRRSSYEMAKAYFVHANDLSSL